MGKQFKATSKLTAKFLVVIMVLQAALFSFTAFGADAGTVEIKKLTAANGADAGTNIAMFLNAAGTAGVPYTLAAKIDAGATTLAEKANTWTSSDESVATATYTAATGYTVTILPKVAGLGLTTMITLRNTKSGITDTVNVTVYKKLTAYTIVPTLKVVKGYTAQIAAATNILPSGATVSSTTYTIPDLQKQYATVDSDGLVTALKKGSATVTIRKYLPDGTSIPKTITVTVTEPVQTVVIKKALDSPTVLGIDASKTIALTGVVGPIEATDKTLSWTSSDPTWVKVSVTGAVYAYPAGIGKTVTITATALDSLLGAKDSVTFTVYKGVTSITLPKSTLAMKIGATKDISGFGLVLPVDADIISREYSIKTGSVTGTAITVDPQTGIITAGNGSGKATVLITIKVHDALTKVLSLVVTVSPASTGVTLAPATVTMKQFETKALAATFLPKTPAVTFKKIDYTTSDAAVAFVNPRTGVVTAVGTGTATITGTPVNGGTAGSVSVTVTAAIED
jgi:uncharacterized protein YjdB